LQGLRAKRRIEQTGIKPKEKATVRKVVNNGAQAPMSDLANKAGYVCLRIGHRHGVYVAWACLSLS
jgi:hypothetical protein